MSGRVFTAKRSTAWILSFGQRISHLMSRTKRLWILCLVFGIAANAKDAPISSAPPVRYRKLVASSGAPTVHLVMFDPKRYTLRVIDNGSQSQRPNFVNLADAMIRNQCIAGTNGGFFDPELFKPSGFTVSGGRTISAFDPKGWQEGMLGVDEGGIFLIARGDFARRSGVKEALQSSPWLIRAGNVESTLGNDARRARRAFVGMSREGECALGFSTAATFYELAALLMRHSVEGAGWMEVLALDGATSAGFWSDIDGVKVSEPELVTVRNFVGIAPRDNAPLPRIIGRKVMAFLVALCAISVVGTFLFLMRRAKRPVED